jgi:beta-lactamase class A
MRKFPTLLLAILTVAGLLAPGAAPAATRDDAQNLIVARAEIEKRIAASGAEVAVAFRTLDGKVQLFLRADDSFHAASTMKVGVMVELFHQVKQGKLKLDDALPVRNEFSSLVDGSPFQLDADSDSDNDVYKKLGGTMTVRELCEHMITRSSNLATNLLIVKLGVKNIRKAMRDAGAPGLDIKRPLEDGKAYAKGISNTTTARALLVLLSRIAQFKAVDRASSLAMLEILKRQTFNEAIPAGLPPGTPVAHKTGEITRIHHDAAIVYAPRSFVLVLLVRGIENRDQSSALLADLTRILYRAVENPQVSVAQRFSQRASQFGRAAVSFGC